MNERKNKEENEMNKTPGKLNEQEEHKKINKQEKNKIYKNKKRRTSDLTLKRNKRNE